MKWVLMLVAGLLLGVGGWMFFRSQVPDDPAAGRDSAASLAEPIADSLRGFVAGDPPPAGRPAKAGPQGTDSSGGGAQKSAWLRHNPHLDEARFLMSMQKVEEAHWALHRANELEPGRPEVAELQGLLHFYTQDWPRAVAAYTAVLEAQPQNDEALLNRALARMAMEEHAEAIVDLEAFLRVNQQPGRRRQAEACLRHCNAVLYLGGD